MLSLRFFRVHSLSPDRQAGPFLESSKYAQKRQLCIAGALLAWGHWDGVGRGDFKEPPNTGLDSGSLRSPFLRGLLFQDPHVCFVPSGETALHPPESMSHYRKPAQ